MFPSRVLVVSVAFVLGFAGLSTPSVASTDNITDMEMMSIPSWCQSAFRNSDYREKIAPKMGFSTAPSKVGGKASAGLQIPGGHHVCAGLVELNRAKRGRGSYKVAISELNYSFSRMEASHPSLSFVSSHLGRALFLSGKQQQGVDIWRSAIAAQPAQRESYLALAEALFGTGQNEMALKILLEYDKAKENDYADVEQFLAQAYFNLKQYDNAKTHAEKALQLGYPFTGLLEKIKKMEGGR